jgi:hypothetical protein
MVETMSPHRFIVVSVTLSGRDDGGLNVSSDELPGLILSGSNRETIAAAIAPTIVAIFEHRGFRNILVHRGTPVAAILSSDEAGHASVQGGVDRVETEQFVIELGALAA